MELCGIGRKMAAWQEKTILCLSTLIYRNVIKEGLMKYTYRMQNKQELIGADKTKRKNMAAKMVITQIPEYAVDLR